MLVQVVVYTNKKTIRGIYTYSESPITRNESRQSSQEFRKLIPNHQEFMGITNNYEIVPQVLTQQKYYTLLQRILKTIYSSDNIQHTMCVDFAFLKDTPFEKYLQHKIIKIAAYSRIIDTCSGEVHIMIGVHELDIHRYTPLTNDSCGPLASLILSPIVSYNANS